MRPRKVDPGEVLKMHESGTSKTEIARELKVTTAAIYRIVKGYKTAKKKVSEAKVKKLMVDVETPLLPKGKV